MRRTPALIVGGGPAGAGAAILLARAGAPHLLIERTRETGDALCGGFLSWRTLETLARLGVEPETLGPARITQLRLFTGNRRAELLLPRPAHGVSRRLLDTVLLKRALCEGAAIERGVTVRTIESRAARLADGTVLQSDALFLASGKHDVRGLARPVTARGSDPSIGLRLRLGPAPGLSALIGDAIELHLLDRGYAGLMLQEDGSANLCLVVRRSLLDEHDTPGALLDHLGQGGPLGDRLAWSAPNNMIDAIANVPYGWRAQVGTDRLFRLGDQAGVIPSLAGEGMGIALASGARAAIAYLRGGAAAACSYQQSFARDLAQPIGIAALLRRAAERPALAAAVLPLAARVPIAMDLLAWLTRIRHSRLDGPLPQKERSRTWTS